MKTFELILTSDQFDNKVTLSYKEDEIIKKYAVGIFGNTDKGTKYYELMRYKQALKAFEVKINNSIKEILQGIELMPATCIG